MSEYISQNKLILSWLRHRGSVGLHTFEMRAAHVGNPSQRVGELEQRGHVISHSRERLNGKAFGCRYVLVQDADEKAAA